MELVEFLRARQSEDTVEAIAGHTLGCAVRDLPDDHLSADLADPEKCSCKSRRLLRDVEAKRRIMWRHQGDEDACADDGLPNPCPTLRLLALPNDDHPDFREEWGVGHG